MLRLLPYSVFESEKVPTRRTIQIAESQSLQSDPFAEFSVYHPSSAFQNIAAYGALLNVSKGVPWQTDREVKFFANLCYNHSYDGKWATFQKILEGSSNYEEFVKVTCDLLGTCTFYGNLIPLMKKYQKTVISKRYDRPTGKVRKPKRRRGYNDKGSLRPKWKRGRNLPDPNSEVEDRRGKVKHPLLNEQFHGGGLCSGSRSPENTRPLNQRKEEDRYDLSGTNPTGIRSQITCLRKIQQAPRSP